MDSVHIGLDRIAIGLALALLVGTLIALRGERLPGRGDWGAGAGLAIPLVAVIAQWVSHAQLNFPSLAWRTGWIRSGDIRLDVGFIQDATGFSVAISVLLVALIVISQRGLFATDHGVSRAFGGVVIGACGAVLAWISLTVWLSFVGLALTLLAGVLAFGGKKDSEQESLLGSRYSRESIWGLLLAALGAGALTGSGHVLAWIPGEPPLTASLSGGLAQEGAVALLLSGLILILRPAPVLGWLVLESSGRPALRVLAAQLLPAVAAFAMIWRLAPLLAWSAVFSFALWVALAFAALGAVGGLLQREPFATIKVWISATLSLALASIQLTGGWPSVALMLTALFFGTTLALILGAPGRKEIIASPWLRVCLLLGALGAAGFPGFLSGSAVVSWLTFVGERPGLMAAPAAAVFFWGVLAWRAAEVIRRVACPVSIWNIMGAVFLILCGAAWLWTGTLMGGYLPGNPDTVTKPLVGDLVFTAISGGRDETWALASTLAAAVFMAAFALGLWLMRAGGDVAARAHKKFPQGSSRIAASFGVDQALVPVERLLNRAGAWLTKSVDERIWDDLLPRGISVTLERAGTAISAFDTRVTGMIPAATRKSVEVPSKLLQLIQSGNVQWYLLFAIGSGMALLLHFLRF